jgi:hypothetical protein
MVFFLVYDIYLLPAVGLSSGGSTHLHTIHRTTNNRTTQITTIVEEWGPCPVFASFTLVFALQLRKTLNQDKETLSPVKKNLIQVLGLRGICGNVVADLVAMQVKVGFFFLLHSFQIGSGAQPFF